jgi:5-methylcytosine-specific restriction endonuclease McrA
MESCQRCGDPIPKRVVVDGKSWPTQNRRYCIKCSPIGTHRIRVLKNPQKFAHGWTDDILREVVSRCKSFVEVNRELKTTYQAEGHHSNLLRREIARLGLDISHWPGRWVKSIESIFTEHGTAGREVIKAKLIREVARKSECAICGLTEWRGQTLALVLDHINGVNDDNRLENLRFLCPNCNTQTPTWGEKTSRSNPPENQTKEVLREATTWP